VGGAAVVFHADGFPGREFAGTVDAPASYVDPATRMAPVRTRVRDDGHDLRPGMSGALGFVVGEAHDAVVVPAAAVVYDGAQPVVFVRVADGRFEPHAVRLGIASGGRLEITDGVEVGAPVATTGAASLLSNARLPAEAD
jgi:multidrug efflux pump subunit AcrA (membrane-fusion protein)